MSQNVFLADYVECADTNREIKSNLNYITDILSRLSKMDSHVSNVSVSTDIWKKNIYEVHIPESDECDGSIAGSDQGGVRSGLTVVSCLINVILIVPRISRNKRRI